jgi:phage-related minor tail protein
MVLIVFLVVIDVLFAEVIKGNLFIAWAILLAICIVASIAIEFVLKRKKKYE